MLWKAGRTGPAQVLIDWLLSQKEQGASWPVTIQLTIATLELAYSTSERDLGESDVLAILDEMFRRHLTTVVDFETAYQDRRRRQEQERRAGNASWHMFLPLYVKLGPNVAGRSVRILGRRYTFCSLASAKRRLGGRVLGDLNNLKRLTGVRIERLPDAFAVTSATGESLGAASRDIETSFATLRGLLEFSFGFLGARIFGPEEPRSKIPHPEWFVGRKRGTATEGLGFYSEWTRHPKPFDLTEDRLRLLAKNSKPIASDATQGTIESLIADCLRLYGQALDARFSYGCFLGLWQTAEAITQSESVGGQTDKVAERLAWHGTSAGLVGTGYSHALRRLGDRRNDLVHRGIQAVTHEDVNILKWAVDIGLQWLIRQRRYLPTVQHLRQFYRIRELNSVELSGLKGAMKYVEKQRRTT